MASFQETWTTGWFWRSPLEEPGPSGVRQVAPSTPAHQGAPGTVASITPALANWRNTNDQPIRSASVT